MKMKLENYHNTHAHLFDIRIQPISNVVSVDDLRRIVESPVGIGEQVSLLPRLAAKAGRWTLAEFQNR